MLGVIVVKYFGRRQLLVSGTLGMAISYFCVGVGILWEFYMTSYCFMLIFILAFNVSYGNVGYIFCAEVTVD